MLVLSRQIGERIRIGDDIIIEITDIRTSDCKPKVRLGIEAPKNISIHREEVYNAILATKRDAGGEEGQS